MGDFYLNIVESKNRETGGFERQSVVLFADDLSEFLSGFEESLRVMEKAIREKKREGWRSQQRDDRNEWRESAPEARRGDQRYTRAAIRKDKPKPPDDGSRSKPGKGRVRVVRRKD